MQHESPSIAIAHEALDAGLAGVEAWLAPLVAAHPTSRVALASSTSYCVLARYLKDTITAAGLARPTVHVYLTAPGQDEPPYVDIVTHDADETGQKTRAKERIILSPALNDLAYQFDALDTTDGRSVRGDHTLHLVRKLRESENS